MLKDLTKLLKKAYDMTIKIQYSDCTPGYFYRQWSGLLLYYNEHGSALAECIKTSMLRREPELLKGDLLTAAIYIDVFHMELIIDADKKESAYKKIEDLNIRLKGLDIDLDEEQVNSNEQDSQVCTLCM